MSAAHIGSKVYTTTSQGFVRELVLGEMVGDGGAVGTVYRVNGSPRECVKVFHDSASVTMTVVRVPKVKEIIAKYEQGEIGGFATLPKSLVYREQTLDTPIGYTMDYFDGVPLSDLAYGGMGESFGFRTRVLAALGLARCVEHAHGISSDPVTRHIVIGDLSLANALYQPGTNNVRIVDPDSFQVIGRVRNKLAVYPVTEMRSSTFETVHAGKPIGKFKLTSRSDNVLLAECIFMLLIQCDPLDDLSLEDVDFDEERGKAVAQRRYPYIENVSDVSDLPETIVGKEISALFVRSFKGSYEDVPTAREYRVALQKLADGLTVSEDGAAKNPLRCKPGPAVIVSDGDTILRPTASRDVVFDAKTIGVGPTTASQMSSSEGLNPQPFIIELLLGAMRFTSTLAPWAVFFLLALYHVTLYLPLGIVALARSFTLNHTVIAATLFSLGMILWKRRNPHALTKVSAMTAVIVASVAIGLLCPSVFGGFRIAKDSLFILLIRLGIL